MAWGGGSGPRRGEEARKRADAEATPATDLAIIAGARHGCEIDLEATTRHQHHRRRSKQTRLMTLTEQAELASCILSQPTSLGTILCSRTRLIDDFEKIVRWCADSPDDPAVGRTILVGTYNTSLRRLLDSLHGDEGGGEGHMHALRYEEMSRELFESMSPPHGREKYLFTRRLRKDDERTKNYTLKKFMQAKAYRRQRLRRRELQRRRRFRQRQGCPPTGKETVREGALAQVPNS
ncbi:hypothetical protein IMZ48_30735, partial [Candidatus Bathyarchaeota archaeon]|nr:hypothetical protein [Candidatus Bathyarchaeota archaeon]